MDGARLGRAAAKLLKDSVPTQDKTNHFAKTAGLFTRHVVGTAFRPLHSWWHQAIGFIFIAVAGVGAVKLFSNPGKLEPVQFFISLIFIVVLSAYGVSSILKARRIASKM